MDTHTSNVRKMSCFFALVLCVLAIIHAALWWPGELTPDSMTQYAAAKAGIYSDHHPAVMSFVWRYLDKIVEGPALMLVMHMLFLYTGLWLFIQTVLSTFLTQKRKMALILCVLLALIPFFPGVQIYSDMIWKDVGFAFAYLLCSGILTRAWVQRRCLSGIEHLFFFAILFYGTSIKFQGQYLAPVMLLWWSMLSITMPVMRIVLIRFFTSMILFYATLSGVNNILVPVKQESHSWQYVKLYDLAAISVYKHTSLFPAFAKTPYYTQEKLEQVFNHRSVDDLAFPADAILRIGKNPDERHLLWSTWKHEVLRAPHIYMLHRIQNLAFSLLSTPGFETFTNILNARYDTHSAKYILLKSSARIFGYMTLAHALYAVLTVVYLLLGAAYCRRSRFAAPLFFMNLASCVMIGALLFFSMAGTPRYTYIMMCLCQVSHVLAFLTWRERTHQHPIKS